MTHSTGQCSLWCIVFNTFMETWYSRFSARQRLWHSVAFPIHQAPCKKDIYSRHSLSRLRFSRITAYLEVKIWSLFLHGNLTIGNKILWKRGEIAPEEQFLLFSTIFSIYLSSGVKLHSGCSVYHFLFPQCWKSDMSRYVYLEVFQRIPWISRYRVDYTLNGNNLLSLVLCFQ